MDSFIATSQQSMPQAQYLGGASFETRKLERLEKKHLRLSRRFANVEHWHRDLGITFHRLDPALRAHLETHSEHGFCAQIFVLTDSSPEPETLQKMTTIRRLRDCSKQALLRAKHRYLPKESEEMKTDLKAADNMLDSMIDLVKDVRDDCCHLHSGVIEYCKLKSTFSGAMEEDADLLDPEKTPRKFAIFKTWLLRLPEVQKQITELGFNESAVLMLYCSDALLKNEDRLVLEGEDDDVDEYQETEEFWYECEDAEERERESYGDIPIGLGSPRERPTDPNLANPRRQLGASSGSRAEASAQPVLSAHADEAEEQRLLNSASALFGAAQFR